MRKWPQRADCGPTAQFRPNGRNWDQGDILRSPLTPLFCRSRAAQSGYSAGPECAAKGYGVILSFQLEPQLSYFRLRLHVMAPGCYFTLSSKM